MKTISKGILYSNKNYKKTISPFFQEISQITKNNLYKTEVSQFSDYNLLLVK